MADIRVADRAGDLGWMVMANGEAYAEQLGWDTSYEALVARIVADFAEKPGRGRAWVAEVDGVRRGGVLCVDDGTEARLRILLVDATARGQGIGDALVRACIDHAREQGFGRLVLWTNDVLASARRIYQAHGFRLLEEERHHSFGHDLVGQSWVLDLS